jgi:hypothetical protein
MSTKSDMKKIIKREIKKLIKKTHKYIKESASVGRRSEIFTFSQHDTRVVSLVSSLKASGFKVKDCSAKVGPLSQFKQIEVRW